MSNPFITILLPQYNEGESLKSLYEQLVAVLEPLGKSFEIIIIDDGSTDNSFDIVRQLHRQDTRVRGIQFQKNYGKSAALSVGFEACRGEYIITMDADLQDDPAEIPKMLSMMDQGYDLISGWKKVRKDPYSKRIPSKIFNWATAFFTGISIHDFNCGFKCYRRKVVEEIEVYGELHRYIPVLVSIKGFKIGELPVVHHPRQFGKSKFGMSRFINGFFDLITVLFISRYLHRPLHLFGILGILSFLLGFIINLYLTVNWFQGVGIGNRPLLFLGILLIIVGIQFVSIGLLGELLTHLRRRGPVHYVIRETIE